MKTFKFRLKPTKGQVAKLQATLDTCRQTYNFFLEERRDVYQLTGKSPSKFEQIKSLAGWTSNTYSQVLQNVADRVHKSFDNFFRRVKSGTEKVGYPRFKSKDRYDSFTYPQSGFKITADNQHIRLSKIGDIRIKLHREAIGNIKTCTIRKTYTGKWYACVSCEQIPISVNLPTTNSIGIDVGIQTLATLTNGAKIDNPRYLKQSEDKLARAQRKHSKSKTKRTKLNVARVYEKIVNQRNDYLHKVARNLVDKYSQIVVENIRPSEMLGDIKNINKAMLDACWNKLISFISYKAEDVGVRIIKVNPAYTSQTCFACGHRQKMPLKLRTYECSQCGYIEDRDVNAANNILARGTTCLAVPA